MEAAAHQPCLFIVATFSRFPEAFDWGRAKAEGQWGKIALQSEAFAFDQTTYYEATMGPQLRKQLWAFEPLFDPGELADRKRLTNRWEQELASSRSWEVERPLNLDPGYLTEAKLVLASTKDRDHRIYLRDGIYAEGTLYFHKKAWRNRSWTYPDFQTESYHAFLTQCREYLRNRLRVT